MFKKDVYELTNPQKNIWQLEQVNEQNPSITHILSIMKLKGNLDVTLLEKTLSKIVEAMGVSMDDIYTDEVREQAIKNLQECSNNFTKNATTDEIIKVYRKMIKNDN